MEDLLVPAFKCNDFVSSFSRISLCHPDSHSPNNNHMPYPSQSSQYHKICYIIFFGIFPVCFFFSYIDSKAYRLSNLSKFPMLVNGRDGLEPLFRSYGDKCYVFSTIRHDLPATEMKAEI